MQFFLEVVVFFFRFMEMKLKKMPASMSWIKVQTTTTTACMVLKDMWKEQKYCGL